MAKPIEQIEAKTVGAAHAIKAGFNGLRGVFLHLAQEHGEVGALIKRVAKSTDVEVRREHYPRIRAELLSHERAELLEVYSVLNKFPETRGLSLAHNREAEQLEEAIARVDALDLTSPEWSAAFEHVATLVQDHVREEETDFFPRAQEILSEDESKNLLARYEAAKAGR
jgi:hemerythrin superfamily protein